MGQTFDASNVNRLYGSRVIDEGLPKLKIIERLIADIGLGTQVRLLPRPITFRSVIEEFRTCDVIFGCTDDEWGRSLLTRLAIYYAIPVFDMGVKIDSKDGLIRSINGRVTTLCRARPAYSAGAGLRPRESDFEISSRDKSRAGGKSKRKRVTYRNLATRHRRSFRSPRR